MPLKKDLLVSIGAKAFGEKKKVSATDDDLEIGFENGYIYKVPNNIRQGNEKAYTPLLISIGPLHYRKKNLAKIAMYKVNYQQKFLERTSEETLKKFWSIIKQKEKVILNCYDALIDEDEFVLMIFYDALFIIELFLRNYEKVPEIEEFLLNETWSAILRRDLILLENQIPLFVLEELYMLYHNFLREDESNSASALPFLHHACIYFDIPWDEEFFKDKDIRHFTDLQRCHLVKNHPPVPLPSEIPDDDQLKILLYNATRLNDAGVKLTADENACLLDIKLEGKELRIPKLTVHSNTEAYIRNVMAFEMCDNPDEAYVCAYIQLLNDLIKSNKDEELLIKKGILSKEGENEGNLISRINPNIMVARMIKKLMHGVDEPSACYRDTGNRLNQLYKKARKKNIRIIFKENLVDLKRVYFTNLWRGTGTIAASAVVVFTFIQTVLAFRK